jgi:transcriptional regulator with XRE-family HTH domain
MQNIPTTEQVAGEIRAEMARQRKRMTDLADELGISYATLNRRLTRKRSFRLDELETIAAYLGTTVTALLGRADAA